MREKVVLKPDKRLWHPSPLIHQVVLVTTMDDKGVENVAPKSLISMFAFDPPILGIGCNLGHRTATNILNTGEFTVNVPSHTIAKTIWRAADLPHPRRVKDLGLTARPSLKVRPPWIEECKAHFECTLDSVKAWGKEVALFGRIVSYTRDADLGETWKDWYRRLSPFVYLEERLFGVVEARSLDEEE